MHRHENQLNRKCFSTLKHSVCSYKIKLGDLSIFWRVFNKIIILLVLVGYEMIIAIYHLIYNARS